jgi:hypothetical protein
MAVDRVAPVERAEAAKTASLQFVGTELDAFHHDPRAANLERSNEIHPFQGLQDHCQDDQALLQSVAFDPASPIDFLDFDFVDSDFHQLKWTVDVEPSFWPPPFGFHVPLPVGNGSLEISELSLDSELDSQSNLKDGITWHAQKLTYDEIIRRYEINWKTPLGHGSYGKVLEVSSMYCLQ